MTYTVPDRFLTTFNMKGNPFGERKRWAPSVHLDKNLGKELVEVSDTITPVERWKQRRIDCNQLRVSAARRLHSNCNIGIWQGESGKDPEATFVLVMAYLSCPRWPTIYHCVRIHFSSMYCEAHRAPFSQFTGLITSLTSCFSLITYFILLRFNMSFYGFRTFKKLDK